MGQHERLIEYRSLEYATNVREESIKRMWWRRKDVIERLESKGYKVWYLGDVERKIKEM